MPIYSIQYNGLLVTCLGTLKDLLDTLYIEFELVPVIDVRQLHGLPVYGEIPLKYGIELAARMTIRGYHIYIYDI